MDLSEFKALAVQSPAEIEETVKRNFPEIAGDIESVPQYENLKYHNFTHVCGILEILSKIATGKYGFISDPFRSFRATGEFPELKALILATLVHDYRHTGKPDSYAYEDRPDVSVNINRALHYLAQVTLPEGYSESDRQLARLIVQYSQYPYRAIEGDHYPFIEVILLFRDLDILHGLGEVAIGQCMLGMLQEQVASGVLPSIDPGVDIAAKQMAFIHSYIPYTESGRLFKQKAFYENTERLSIWTEQRDKLRI